MFWGYLFKKWSKLLNNKQNIKHGFASIYERFEDRHYLEKNEGT